MQCSVPTRQWPHSRPCERGARQTCTAMWTAPHVVVIGRDGTAAANAAEHSFARGCLDRPRPPHSLCALHRIAFGGSAFPSGRRSLSRARCIRTLLGPKGIDPCWRILCVARMFYHSCHSIAGCWSRRAGSRSAQCRRSTHGPCHISRRRRPRHRRAGRIGTTARTPQLTRPTEYCRVPLARGGPAVRPPARACHRSRATHGTAEIPRSPRQRLFMRLRLPLISAHRPACAAGSLELRAHRFGHTNGQSLSRSPPSK